MLSTWQKRMEKKRTTYISIRYPWTPPLPPPPPIGNLDEDSEKLQTTFVLPKIMNKKFNLKLHNEGPLEPVGDGSTWSPLHRCLPPARLPPQGPHQVGKRQLKILYLNWINWASQARQSRGQGGEGVHNCWSLAYPFVVDLKLIHVLREAIL